MNFEEVDDEALGAPFRPTLADRLDDLFDRLDSWRERPVVVAAGVAGSVVIALLWWLGRPSPQDAVEAAIPSATSTEGAAVEVLVTGAGGSAPTAVSTLPMASTATLVVHVAGAVEEPGVYELDEGERILDAVEAAGGATPDAALDRLNLAAPLVDGMQIRVPAPDDAFETVNLPGSEVGTGLIDLNRADTATLDTLPGIGPATAAAIVAHREEHGPFGSVEELLEVSGIGPAKLAGLSDLVTAS